MADAPRELNRAAVPRPIAAGSRAPPVAGRAGSGRAPAHVTDALVARAARRPRARPGPPLRGLPGRRGRPRHRRAGEGAEVTRYVQVLDERPSGVAWVVATGEPLVVPDARASQGVAPGPRRALQRRLDGLPADQLGRRGALRRDPHQPRAARLRRRDDRPRRDARQPGSRRARAARVRAAPRRPRRARRRAEPRRGRPRRDPRARRGARDARARGRPRHGRRAAGVYLADGSGGGIATAGHNVDPRAGPGSS